MTVSNNIISISEGCKSPDGRHICGSNGRCLVCWQIPGASEQASRVLVITISAECSERERVDGLAEIIEAQVHGIFATVALMESVHRHVNAISKPVELEVCVS
jgi:hypothetical protein